MSVPPAIFTGTPGVDATTGTGTSDTAARRAASNYRGRNYDPAYCTVRTTLMTTRVPINTTSNAIAIFKGSIKEVNGCVFQCYGKTTTKNQYHPNIQKLNGYTGRGYQKNDKEDGDFKGEDADEVCD